MEFEHFFIVGAQRSGTSYLYRLLEEHPEIEMARPLRPEPKFFFVDALFEKGMEYYGRHFFKQRGWLRGEKSVCYMESEKAASRIVRFLPKAKILFLLRDPIQRAISNYWYSVNNGFETSSLSDAFLLEEERRKDYDHTRVSVSPFAYLHRGRYIDHIFIYERYFPSEHIKVMLFEDLIGSLNHFRELCEFLHVGTNFSPSKLNQVVHTNDRPDSELSSELRCHLITYFADSNARLARRFGLNLDVWQSFHT